MRAPLTLLTARTKRAVQPVRCHSSNTTKDSLAKALQKLETSKATEAPTPSGSRSRLNQLSFIKRDHHLEPHAVELPVNADVMVNPGLNTKLKKGMIENLKLPKGYEDRIKLLQERLQLGKLTEPRMLSHAFAPYAYMRDQVLAEAGAGGVKGRHRDRHRMDGDHANNRRQGVQTANSGSSRRTRSAAQAIFGPALGGSQAESELDPVAAASLRHALEARQLAFLGDAVLQMAATSYAFQAFPTHTPGQLAEARADFVSNKSLARVLCEHMQADDLVLIPRSVLFQSTDSLGEGLGYMHGTTVEALIAVVYLQLGLEEALRFTHQHILLPVSVLRKRPALSYAQCLERRLRAQAETEEAEGGEQTETRFRLYQDYSRRDPWFRADVVFRGKVIAYGESADPVRASNAAAIKGTVAWQFPEGLL